jgi:hypothetical protein
MKRKSNNIDVKEQIHKGIKMLSERMVPDVPTDELATIMRTFIAIDKNERVSEYEEDVKTWSDEKLQETLKKLVGDKP